MGDIGDYWNDAKDSRNFHTRHGHWPDERICTRCKTPFRHNGKKITVCRYCAQAWAAGYELLPRKKGTRS